MNRQGLKKLKLPDKPGVYFFLDQKKKPIYIGRATSLRDRVRSYFSKDLIETRGPMIVDMVFKAKGLKWMTSDSALETLILEVNLIKKFQPIYNTKEKSDKSFNYVCITHELLPRVVVKRGRQIENLKDCYGPYTNNSALQEALKIIRKIFPFLDEKSGVRGRYEFYKQIGLVPDVGVKKEYLKNIKNIKLFLEGKKERILKNLEREMKNWARDQKFEKAHEVKKKIFALKHIQDVALIKEDKKETKEFRIEAYDVAHFSGSASVGVMTVFENGEIKKSDYRKFKLRDVSGGNDIRGLQEILKRRLAHYDWPLPDLIVVDGGKAQLNGAEKILQDSKIKIPVVSVLKNEHHKPKQILGNRILALKYESAILLANSEAHRFAIGFHRNLLRKTLK